MKDRPPELDMTLEGEFRTPPMPQKPTVLNRLLFWAIVVAVITGALTIAAFVLWFALLILPIALGAAVVAWLLFRYKLWRARQSFRSGGGGYSGGDILRP